MEPAEEGSLEPLLLPAQRSTLDGSAVLHLEDTPDGSKTRASNAVSHTARLTTTVIRQKISLLVGVKKKMVLLLLACETRAQNTVPNDIRLRFVIHALVVNELDGHSQPVLFSDGVAHDHKRDVFVAERLGTAAAHGLS